MAAVGAKLSLVSPCAGKGVAPKLLAEPASPVEPLRAALAAPTTAVVAAPAALAALLNKPPTAAIPLSRLPRLSAPYPAPAPEADPSAVCCGALSAACRSASAVSAAAAAAAAACFAFPNIPIPRSAKADRAPFPVPKSLPPGLAAFIPRLAWYRSISACAAAIRSCADPAPKAAALECAVGVLATALSIAPFPPIPCVPPSIPNTAGSGDGAGASAGFANGIC